MDKNWDALLPLSVDYATADGTATAGLDYVALSGTLRFETNESSKTFSIPLLNDGLAEGPESIGLSLSRPVGEVTLGPQSNAVAVIYDGDTGIEFTQDTLTRWEHDGEAELIVAKHRNGPTGVVRLAFLDHYTKFANMARGA